MVACATEAMLAHVLISKYSDSLPLYRRSKMLARHGVALDRSTLSNWVGRACWRLTPLYKLVVATVLSSLSGDELVRRVDEVRPLDVVATSREAGHVDGHVSESIKTRPRNRS